VQRGDSTHRFDRARFSNFSAVADLDRTNQVIAREPRFGGNEVTPAFNLHPDIDELPEEHPITIEINGHPVAKLICTPSELAELGAGWVLGQGYVDRADELRSVNPRSGRISVMIDAPGPGGAAWQVLMAAGFDARNLSVPDLSELGLRPLALKGLPEAWTMPREPFLAAVGSVFDAFRDERGSGGFHHAGATDGAQPGPTFRDISRHNAVDKVVGWSLLKRVDRHRQILCLSGRISADIVVKAWRAGFPAIATRSLPTAEAVELAHLGGIMLVGRVLDGRRSVFSHGWRISPGEGDL
jgi:FdhD protein